VQLQCLKLLESVVNATAQRSSRPCTTVYNLVHVSTLQTVGMSDLGHAADIFMDISVKKVSNSNATKHANSINNVTGKENIAEM